MLYFLFCKENKNKIEPYAQLVEEALIQHNLQVVKKEN